MSTTYAALSYKFAKRADKNIKKKEKAVREKIKLLQIYDETRQCLDVTYNVSAEFDSYALSQWTKQIKMCQNKITRWHPLLGGKQMLKYAKKTYQKT